MSHVVYFRAMLMTLGLIVVLNFFDAPGYLTYILMIVAIILGFISYRKKGKE